MRSKVKEGVSEGEREVNGGFSLMRMRVNLSKMVVKSFSFSFISFDAPTPRGPDAIRTQSITPSLHDFARPDSRTTTSNPETLGV